MLVAQPPQQTNRSGRGVELCDLVLLDGFPVARGRGVYGRGLEEGGSYSKGEGTVDDVPDHALAIRKHA